MAHELSLNVRIHDEGDGVLWAEVLELPGCFASGATVEELREAVAEAVGLYLNTTITDGQWSGSDDDESGHDGDQRVLLSV
jgi:predicted RNase H-like HicB family nuclease